MRADFTITIHRDDHPDRSVRVVVHDNLRALRSAATRYRRSWKQDDEPAEPVELLGVCHRFETQGTSKTGETYIDPLCACVRLSKPHLGVGMISHELAHAAVWIRELDTGEDTPLNCTNDEDFCWVLGELVHRTVAKLYEKGIY